MHRNSLVGVALVASLAVLLVVPSGSAAAKKRRTVDSTIQAVVVGGSATGTAIIAGTVSDPRFGDGATVYKTQPPQGAVQESSFTAFFDKGTFKGNATVTLTPQADGSVLLEGDGEITRGTGRYKGARGTLEFVGAISAEGLIQFTAKGSVRY